MANLVIIRKGIGRKLKIDPALKVYLKAPNSGTVRKRKRTERDWLRPETGNLQTGEVGGKVIMCTTITLIQNLKGVSNSSLID